jgi:polar amino acid transport system substrate-binding protein
MIFSKNPASPSRAITARRLVRLVVPAALVAALAACSSSSSSSSSAGTASAAAAVTASTASGADAAARALLPASIKSAGVLTMVSDFEYPPFAMYDSSGNFEGIDYEIGSRLAAILGLKAQWSRSVGFSTLIPAVQSGKAEVAMEDIGINSARDQIVSFVQYVSNHDTALTAQGNPQHVDPANLCGVSLADQAGDFEGGVEKTISTACVSAGKPAIKVSTFPTVPSAVLALKSGRVAGFLEGVPSCAYDAKQDPTLGCTTDLVPNDTSYAGIAVAKSETQLGQALTAALRVAQQDGSYAAILKKWGAPAIAATPEFVQ